MLNKMKKLRHGALLLAACAAALMLAACSAAEDRIPGAGEPGGTVQETIQETNGMQAESTAAGGQEETQSTASVTAPSADADGQSGGSPTGEQTQQQNGQGAQASTGKQTQKQTQGTTRGTTTAKKTAAAASKPAATTRKSTTATTKKSTATTRTTASSAVSENGSGVQQEVLRLVNVQREKAGKQPLTLDAKLSQAAQVRAAEIVQLFSHDRPDGTSCFTAMKEAGVSYRAAGENIAAGQRTPAEVMEGWMNSQGHRENILSDSFGRLGVGYTVVNGRAYWVQMFAD